MKRTKKETNERIILCPSCGAKFDVSDEINKMSEDYEKLNEIIERYK